LDTLFLTLGAPFYREAGRLFVEAQTVSGLKAWQADFDRLIAASICKPGAPPAGWVDAAEAGITGAEFELMELPDGYHLPTYLRTRAEVARRMRDALRRADYRLFAIGGWLGDWGVFGARLAQAEAIPHGIWFDRVESQVLAGAHDGSLKERLKAWIKSRVTARREAQVLAHADMALLHGQTVFDRFRGMTRRPVRVEDIHLEASDRIPVDRLARKLAEAEQGPLALGYVGRADRMKGPLLWVEALARLSEAGVDFTAEWAGDGPMLDEMKDLARARGIGDRLVFHGFVSDRDEVKEILRRAQVLLFCHMTDESPRNLIEALFSATPLVGFADTYARKLVEEQDAGLLVERGDVDGLVAALTAMDGDRARLSALIERAGRSALHLTRSEVFSHRARLIRENLSSPAGDR